VGHGEGDALDAAAKHGRGGRGLELLGLEPLADALPADLSQGQRKLVGIALLVDHDMGLVLGISDYVVVLEFGRVIAHGPPEVARREPQVIRAYLGSAAAELQPVVDAS
jgi:branched-chain amino acid transport system ATP-binding protein